MVISCDKIFLLVSKYLSLWSWPSLELAIIGGIVFHKHILLVQLIYTILHHLFLGQLKSNIYELWLAKISAEWYFSLVAS